MVVAFSKGMDSIIKSNGNINDADLLYQTLKGIVFVSRQKFTLEDTIEFHAFAPLEALPCE
jgi:hypothetical protein